MHNVRLSNKNLIISGVDMGNFGLGAAMNFSLQYSYQQVINFAFFFCSDDDIHVEDPPKYDAGLDNIIVVDNIPVVPQEKFQKLEMALRKVYGKIDCQLAVIKDDGFWIPVDPVTQKTLGYCFIEYNTRQVPLLVYPIRIQKNLRNLHHDFSLILLIIWDV